MTSPGKARERLLREVERALLLEKDGERDGSEVPRIRRLLSAVVREELFAAAGRADVENANQFVQGARGVNAAAVRAAILRRDRRGAR